MTVDEARGLIRFQWPCGHGLLLRKRSLWRGRLWSRASARDETGLGEAGRKQRIWSNLTRFVEVFQNGLPASDTLWAYAEKMAKPYGIQVPPPLRANRDWFGGLTMFGNNAEPLDRRNDSLRVVKTRPYLRLGGHSVYYKVYPYQESLCHLLTRLLFSPNCARPSRK